MNPADTRNRYGDLCTEAYDLDKPPGSLFDIPYYTQRLAGIDGPILEAAVGTGRLAVPLAEAGKAIWGFDHSPHMLAVCARHAEARGLKIPLQEAGFSDFQFDQAFEAIIVPASSFVLVDEFDQALAVLERFRDHLAPGGLLLVDLPPLSFLDAPPASSRLWTTTEGDLIRMESVRATREGLAQRRANHDRYERWRDGRLVDAQLEIWSCRVWGLEEFRMALERTGFTDIAVCGDYRTGRPVRPQDQLLNYSARRST